MTELINKLVTVLVVVFAMTSVMEVSAQTHHVLTGDSGGWSTSSSGRIFRVGDKISFTYPATEETILELESLEDFLACNLNNPIKMYTDGSSHVTLEKEGVRYFTSSNLESCKNGFKLPVPVQSNTESVTDHLSDPIPFGFPPPAIWPPVEPLPQAPPPPSYSGSDYLSGLSFALLAGLGLGFIGL